MNCPVCGEPCAWCWFINTPPADGHWRCVMKCRKIVAGPPPLFINNEREVVDARCDVVGTMADEVKGV